MNSGAEPPNRGRLWKVAFFAVVVRPLVLIGLGLNVVGRRRLPAEGPAVLAANHNSHLDTVVLMSLFPLSRIQRVRAAGAADYFFASPTRAWFSRNLFGTIPMDRSGERSIEAVFEPLLAALDAGEIVILFPEGSRGEPEQLGRVRKGIHHLLRQRPDVPVVPVAMHGLGQALPRGEALFVPFNCDVIIGEPMFVTGKASTFTAELTERLRALLKRCLTRTADSSTPNDPKPNGD